MYHFGFQKKVYALSVKDNHFLPVRIKDNILGTKNGKISFKKCCPKPKVFTFLLHRIKIFLEQSID